MFDKRRSHRGISFLLCILMLFSSVSASLRDVILADTYTWVNEWYLNGPAGRVGTVNVYDQKTWHANTVQDAYALMPAADLSNTTPDAVISELIASYTVGANVNSRIYKITGATYVENKSTENTLWFFNLTVDLAGDVLGWNDNKGTIIFNVGIPDIVNGPETVTGIGNWRLLSKNTMEQVAEAGWRNSTIALSERVEESDYETYGEVLKSRYYLSLRVNDSYGANVTDNIYMIRDIVLVSATDTTVTYKIVTKDALYWSDGGSMELYLTVKPMNAPGEKHYNSYEWQVVGYSQIRNIGLTIILGDVDYENDVQGKEEAYETTLKTLYHEIRVHEEGGSWPWHLSAIKNIKYDPEKSKEFSSGIRNVAAYRIEIWDEYYAGGKLAEFYIAITGPADFGDLSTITVPSKEPQGIKMNLFDYWTVTDDPRDEAGNPWEAVFGWENNDGLIDEKYNGGINAGHALKFFNTSPTDGNSDNWNAIGSYGVWNHSTTNGRQNITGIVANLLEKGFPRLQLNTSHGDDIWTDFTRSHAGNLRDITIIARDESLAYLFDPTYEHEGKATYKNVLGLLQLNDQGYYYYDSKLNFAQFDALTNEFLLYNTWGVVPQGDSPHGQFFPFNRAEQIFSDVSEELDENGQRTLTQYEKAEVNSRSPEMNHHFGFTMEVDFQQPSNGQVNHRIESIAEDMVFKFAGDDDCWVFVDGVLVLDLGGVHSGLYGDINFATGEVRTGLMDGEIGAGVAMGQQWTSTTLYDLFAAAGVAGDDDIAWGTGAYEKTFAFETLHTIQIFYMERGHWDSNFAMYFNLQPRVPHKVYKVDEDGNPLEGAVFALYAAEPKEGVYKENETYHTADEFEKVNAFVQGGPVEPITEDFFVTDGTGYVTLSGIDFATRASSEEKFYYILEEIDPPSGARKLQTPIVLEYGFPDPDISEEDKPYKGVFTVLNQYETGAYASFSAIIEDNGEKMYYATTTVGKDEEGNTTFDIEGTTEEIRDIHQDSALLFAVPMIYTDIGKGLNWYPIYGSNTNGYHIVDIYQPGEYFNHPDSDNPADGGTDDVQNSYRWALRHNLLAAAMRQVADERGPDWYFRYETITTADGTEAYSRFTAELSNLPGDASRYLVNNRNITEYDIDSVDLRLIGVLVDAEAIVALLGMDPENSDDVAKIKNMSDEEKYLALQNYLTARNFESKWDETYETDNDWIRDWLDEAYVQKGSENTRRDRGVNLADINTFTRYYGSVFYIPNERRELRVMKQDVNGNPVADAEFGLFDSFDDAVNYSGKEDDDILARGTTGTNGILIFSYTRDTSPANAGSGWTFMNWDGYADEENDHVVWVRELKAPKGYTINESIVEVYVGEHSIYANASAYRAKRVDDKDPDSDYKKDSNGHYIPELIDSVSNAMEVEELQSGGKNEDGVTVWASVGKLFQSMEKFADSLLNSTLLDIDGRNLLFMPGGVFDNPDPKNSDIWADAGDEILHLHFWDRRVLGYTSSDYSTAHTRNRNGTVGGEAFSVTENGYLRVQPTQTAREIFESQHQGDEETGTRESRRDLLYMKDGSPLDLSNVFSPVNIIVVQDLFAIPHVNIEKEQSLTDENDRTKEELEVTGGSIVTYYLTMTSDGDENDDAKDVIVTDTIPGLPKELQFIAGSIKWGVLNEDGSIAWGNPADREITGEYDEASRTITWNLGDMPYGERIIVCFQVKVPYVSEESEWVNSASLTYEDPEDSGKRADLVSNEVVIYEPVHNLTVSKEVTGGGDTEKTWNFTVELTTPQNEEPLLGSYKYVKYGANGETEEGFLELSEDTLSFTLKHGEKIIIYGLPHGAEYTVTEAEANADNYVTTVTGDAAGTLNADVVIEFENYLPVEEEPSGSLTVKKETGDADTEITFTFTAKLTLPAGATPGNYTYTYSNGNTGTIFASQFKLIDGRYTYTIEEIFLTKDQSVTFEGLPVGTEYIVTETDPNGYDLVAITPEQGSNLDDRTASGAVNASGAEILVVFLNEKSEVSPPTNPPADLPETGGMGTKLFYVIGCLMFLCAGGCLVFKRTKKKVF